MTKGEIAHHRTYLLYLESLAEGPDAFKPRVKPEGVFVFDLYNDAKTEAKLYREELERLGVL